MKLIKQTVKLLTVFGIVFSFYRIATAASLFPDDIGVWYEYNKHDSASPQNEWVVKLEVLDKVTVVAQEYCKLGEWNYSGSGDYNEFFIRPTENAVYALEDGIEYLSLQIAPVGTRWDFPHSLGSQTGKTVREIVSIEQVVVPYGTFDNAYVHRNYFDYDDPAIENSPYWYEYVVPNVGVVKEVDFNLRPDELYPPHIQELTMVGGNVVPEPVSCLLFSVGGLALAAVRKFKKGNKK